MANDANTTISLPLTKKDYDGTTKTAQLDLRTYRASNGQLLSQAHVSWVGGGFQTTEIFGDFSKVYARTAARGTQKNIDAQHAEVFTPANVEILKSNVALFYETKRAREAREERAA